MTTTKCRDCHRPITDPASRERGRGSQCWQDHLATLGTVPVKTLGRGRRDWAAVMPGQEELQLEVAP
jgi:hypothetical protein